MITGAMKIAIATTTIKTVKTTRNAGPLETQTATIKNSIVAIAYSNTTGTLALSCCVNTP